jgi:hypothetical protein
LFKIPVKGKSGIGFILHAFGGLAITAFALTLDSTLESEGEMP